MGDKTYLTVGVKPYYLRVFRNALKVIGTPPYVRFLIEPETSRMAMIAHDRKELTSFRVPPRIKESGNKNDCVKVFSHVLCKALYRQFEWDTSKTYRIPGKIIRTQRVVVYDLSEAFPLHQTGE